jgi:hypothetical protein
LQIFGEWRNPAFRRCYRKIAYSTWKKAEERAEKAGIRTGELIHAYKCPECRMFHIGHPDQSEKIRRELAVWSLNSRCPRCNRTVSDERRYQAAESGKTTVYCSQKCQDSWRMKNKKKRGAKKLASDADME